MTAARGPRPFEVDLAYLHAHLDAMVESVFADLQSQFLVLPRGKNLVTYGDFQTAYEVLKRHTAAFATVSEEALWHALRENALVLLVVRTILGLSPPEWADLARSERGSDIEQGYARNLERRARESPEFIGRLRGRRDALALARLDALVSVAVHYITQGAPAGAADTVHRLDRSSGFRLLLVRLWDVSPSRCASGLRHDATRADCARTPPRRILCGHAPSRGSKSAVSPDVL